MKVLLEQDVKGTGKKGQIVEVSDGYGRNFLLPRKLASPADAASINAANIRKSAAQHKKFQEGLEARELAQRLSGLSVVVKAKVGEHKKLFGSIGAKEISAALLAQHGIEVDRKKLTLGEPIKSLGKRSIGAKLFPGSEASFSVDVVAEE